MYAPDWYVSDGHLFAWLLIKSDNYELLQQTCTQLVILDQWEIPRTSLYYSPVAGKSRSSPVYSTVKAGYLTHLPFSFQVSSLQSTLCPLQNFLHAITLCLVRRRVTYLLSQCKFLTRHSLNSEQQGFCFQNLSSTLTTKETTTTDKE